MVDITEAVTYPTESEESVKIILIGGILSLLSFLVIPAILLQGYLIQVIRARFDEAPELPAFDDWGTLLTDGVQALVIGIIYLLVPLLVGGVTIGGSILAIATGTRSGGVAGFGGLIIGFLLSAVLGLVFGYLAVAAILNFAHEGDLSAGFDFDAIKTLVVSSDYAVAWGAAIAVFIVTSIIAGMLNIIPFLGGIVGAFLFFYAQLVAAYLWAEGFTKTTASVTAESPTRADTSKH
jgi:hypothetical protein